MSTVIARANVRGLAFVAAVVGTVGFAWAQSAHDHGQPPAHKHDESLIRVPPAMDAEHDELHQALTAAIAAGGETGDAAREVEKHLVPHFEEENRVALPPLGLLLPLVETGPTEAMRPAIAMAKHTEASLAQFADEHQAIQRALDQLEQAARAEGKLEHLDFVNHLRAHAQEEELVLYPATVIIGRYLEMALAQPGNGHAEHGHHHEHGDQDGHGTAGGEGGATFDLAEVAAQLHAQPREEGKAHRQRPLYQHGPVNVTLMQFEQGAYIAPHAVVGVVMAHVLEGRLQITIGDQVHDLRSGEVLVMDPDVEHDVRAIEASRMLRTISRSGR